MILWFRMRHDALSKHIVDAPSADTFKRRAAAKPIASYFHVNDGESIQNRNVQIHLRL